MRHAVGQVVQGGVGELELACVQGHVVRTARHDLLKARRNRSLDPIPSDRLKGAGRFRTVRCRRFHRLLVSLVRHTGGLSRMAGTQSQRSPARETLMSGGSHGYACQCVDDLHLPNCSDTWLWLSRTDGLRSLRAPAPDSRAIAYHYDQTLLAGPQWAP